MDIHPFHSQNAIFLRGTFRGAEMQIEWTDSFKQRLLFESGQAFVKQLQKGEDYRVLQPVTETQIAIASSLKKTGMSLQDIQKHTGLSVEEIQKL